MSILRVPVVITPTILSQYQCRGIGQNFVTVVFVSSSQHLWSVCVCTCVCSGVVYQTAGSAAALLLQTRSCPLHQRHPGHVHAHRHVRLLGETCILKDIYTDLTLKFNNTVERGHFQMFQPTMTQVTSFEAIYYNWHSTPSEARRLYTMNTTTTSFSHMQ